MKRLFVQTSLFRQRIDELGAGELLRQIENAILETPGVGDAIAGTGGVRKFRLPDESRGKGKRGGLRVLFLDLAKDEETHLIYLYSKDEMDDISFAARKTIKELVRRIKEVKYGK